MDKMKVVVLSHTPEHVLKAAMEKPYRNQFNEKNWRQISKKVLFTMKHESVAEHIYVNFDCLGFSRLVLQEWARHRIASPTVESSRFTITKILKEGSYDPVVPPQLRDCELYKEWMEVSKDFLTRAINEKGYKNDVAKYFLTENFRVNMTWSANARAIWNFLKLRMGNKENKPHFEIKHIANLMYDALMETEIAWLFDHQEDFRSQLKGL